MNIEEFVSEDNHMCNLGDDLFYKIFELEAIYDLPDNEFNRKIVYWLSQYLVGNLRKPLDEGRMKGNSGEEKYLRPPLDN
ncbi:hypothetical protein QX208_26240 [Klebsiella pneumoniae]|uniref:hypothetical protein n=1 Tax=Klebsiella pneumoniae TaxID=573 RepID=UPI0025B3D2AF|nr:hypothetical protein [Klebsiella pneumoniae]MDN3967215.1 hypothetical protein [Klebsiella pneumoniae]